MVGDKLRALVCPVCGGNDDIRKVSAIVKASGTSRATQTAIARTLEAPMAPEAGPEMGVAGKIVLGALAFAALMGLTENLYHKSVVIGFIGFFTLTIPFTVFLLTLRSRRHTEVKAKLERATARWGRMILAWDGLYYCSRDDVVFPQGNPSDNFRPGQLYSWLADKA